jgi:hypothetical protein
MVPGVARWAQVALVSLGAIAVVAFVVLVVDNHSRDQHQSACTSYHDALVLAYSDPMTAPPPRGLSRGDSADIIKSRATYQAGYRRDGQPPASSPTTVDYSSPGAEAIANALGELGMSVSPPNGEILPNPVVVAQLHATELAAWQKYASEQITLKMAQRHC